MDMIPDELTTPVIAAGVVVLLTLLFFLFAGKPDKKAQLQACEVEVRKLVDSLNCGPILIRLAWHDSGTYDKDGGEWPKCGGANGSIRFSPEIDHGANAGLNKAVSYLKPLKAKFRLVGWADLMQMGSAVAVEAMGGPAIPVRYGRVDAKGPEHCPREGNLPDGNAPFGDGSKDAASHLRKVFYRMGFDDQQIVALSGAHTIGRAFKERSGATAHGIGDDKGTKFTCPVFVARADNKPGVGMAGGQSWTEKWLSFDNSYFAKPTGKELLRLETDLALATDASFKPYFTMYANSQQDFFNDYAKAHAKLSELGSMFEPAEGITL